MPKKGKKGVPGRGPNYSESFKIAVAREYLLGTMSYGQLMLKYKLPTPDTPRYFVNWYKQWLERQKATAVESAPLATGHLELTDKLRLAELRITALEMVIQNAEKELGVEIIKKSGTKQQDK